jgi:hypothetical protein
MSDNIEVFENEGFSVNGSGGAVPDRQTLDLKVRGSITVGGISDFQPWKLPDIFRVVQDLLYPGERRS